MRLPIFIIGFFSLLFFTGAVSSELRPYKNHTAIAIPKLHFIVFIQKDEQIGVIPDKITLKRISETIDSTLNGTNQQISVNVQFFDSESLTESFVSAHLKSLKIGADDIVWCYYSGHGSNYDNWPRTSRTSFPQTTLNQLVQQTGARLSITTYDCCNVMSAVVPPELLFMCTPGYDKLLLQSKGNIKIASCEPKTLSWGLKLGGGIFTNCLSDNIGCYSTWNDVLQHTRDDTYNYAKNIEKRQIPIFAFSADFQDGTFNK